MDLQRDYEIVQKFNSFQELGDFVTEMDEFREYKINKMEKKLNDKRGSHTKVFHEKARDYHLEHPDFTYARCMAFVRSGIV